MKSTWRSSSLSFLLFALANMAIAEGDGLNTQDLYVQGTDISAETHQYVVSEMLIPSSSAEAASFGLDIDGDSEGRVDNAFGQFLASFGDSVGLDFQAATDEQVLKGIVIHLLNLRAASLSSTNEATLSIFNGGNPSTAPCVDESTLDCGYHLDGNTSFDIVPAASSQPMNGSIAAGEFTGGPGSFQLSLPFLGRTMPIYLIGARSIASANSSSLTGKIGGGITTEVVESTVIPLMTASFSDVVEEDCSGTPETGCCDSGSSGESLIEFFDEPPEDCQISEDEVRNNELLSIQLQPDIDLLDASGDFNPGQDGVNDSLSFGIRFDSVGAEFKLVIFRDSFEL